MLASNLLVLATLALSAVALSAPHNARSAHHRAVARHAEPALAVRAPGTTRQLRKRCQPRQAPLAVTTSTSTTSTTTSSNAAASASAAEDAGGDPNASQDAAPTNDVPTAAPTSDPAPTTDAPPAYTPSSTADAPPPASTSGGGGDSGSSGSGTTQTGDGTFYATGLGACGITNYDSDYIAAVSHQFFDSYPGYDGTNPNNNPICNKPVTACYNGKCVSITITDRCGGCATPTDLDFSPAAFDQLADPSVGRIVGMAWTITS